jgi:hypothetical protein
MKMTDKDKLAEWFQEYALWEALRLPEDNAAMADGSGEEDFAREPAPADRQIRLWAGADQPLYGCVLGGGYDQWRVVPFSALCVPAVPQEMRLRTEGPAQVLEGWNVRRIPGRLARKSWKVDDLRESERFEVESWLLTVEAGGDPPPMLRDRTGPPLRHPMDPRQDYLLSEGSRVDGVLGEPEAVYGEGTGSLPKAAENPEEDYGDGEE